MLYSLLGFVVKIIGLINVYIFKVNKYITKLGSFIIISRECRYTTQTLNLTNTDFCTSFIAISCKTKGPKIKWFLKISPKKMENVIKHVCDCLRVNLKNPRTLLILLVKYNIHVHMSLIIRGILYSKSGWKKLHHNFPVYSWKIMNKASFLHCPGSEPTVMIREFFVTKWTGQNRQLYLN